MSNLLARNTTPAERARGCSHSEQFETAGLVARNGGVIQGDPVIKRGAVLDGVDDYFVYPGYQLFEGPATSVFLDFTSTFSYLDGVARILLDTTGTDRYLIYKSSSNNLTVLFGNTTILNAASGVYGSYWNEFGRNVLAVSATSGANYLYLNGTLIGSSVIAWTPDDPVALYVGASNTGASEFIGTFHSVKIFKRALTEQEIVDLTNDTTYEYRRETSLYLPMGMGEHDPDNVRTLDISGNARHAVFGDGVTPTTYPTKLTRRHGYDFDGGDHLVAPGTGVFNAAGVTMVWELRPSRAFADGTVYYLHDSSNPTRYYSFIAADGSWYVALNGVDPGRVTPAIMAPYWNVGGKITMVLSAISGHIEFWINGILVRTSTTAWTFSNPAEVFIGAAYTASLRYTGEYNSFRVWRKALTPIQIHDLTIESERRAGNL